MAHETKRRRIAKRPTCIYIAAKTNTKYPIYLGTRTNERTHLWVRQQYSSASIFILPSYSVSCQTTEVRKTSRTGERAKQQLIFRIRLPRRHARARGVGGSFCIHIHPPLFPKTKTPKCHTGTYDVTYQHTITYRNLTPTPTKPCGARRRRAGHPAGFFFDKNTNADIST